MIFSTKLRTLVAASLASLALITAGCGGGGEKKPEAKPAAAQTQDLKGKKLVMYVSFHQDTAQALADQFKKETGAEVSFIRLSTGEATARMTAEKAAPEGGCVAGRYQRCP